MLHDKGKDVAPGAAAETVKKLLLHDSRIRSDLALPWRSVLEMVVLAGQGRRQVFDNSSHGYKCFDAGACCQARMDAGHGGLVLAAWCLALPTRPESRSVLLSFSHSNRAMSWQ